jgi:hypothetical protein
MSKLQSAMVADLTLRLMCDEWGTTAIEYAILASGVAVAIAERTLLRSRSAPPRARHR